jgi:hypothetical protein
MTQTVPVTSSLLCRVAYSAPDTLDLTFNNGAVYRYFDIC